MTSKPFAGLLLIGLMLTASCVGARELTPPTNFFNETGALLDMEDPILDDKGPGYYQYPLDSRIPRGTYDLKRFSAFEEGDMIVFVIQMREYIMTTWPNNRIGAEQGFVAQTFDIYIDTDRKADSGYKKTIPGRDLEFANGMGWEKMILVTPLSQYRVFDILKNKTDDLELQNQLQDIIIPDYVQVQRDKLIVKISKEFLGKPAPAWGFQCLVMGFSNVVSTNQLLTKDVKAFATAKDFGGGWDTYGDPPVIDCLVPEGEDQYQILKDYRSEPYREEIQYARIPFIFPKLPEGKKDPALAQSPVNPQTPQAASPGSQNLAKLIEPEPEAPVIFTPLAPKSAAKAPVPAPANTFLPKPKAPAVRPLSRPASAESFDSIDFAPPVILSTTNQASGGPAKVTFMPLKKKPVRQAQMVVAEPEPAGEFLPIPKKSGKGDQSAAFKPLKKAKANPAKKKAPQKAIEETELKE